MKMKIIPVKPKQYLEQGFRFCGGYTIKAILSAYNLDEKQQPKDYLPFLGKVLGFATARTIQDIFKKYGFQAPILRAKNCQNKIAILKKELEKNHPVIIRIGNGYSKQGSYSLWRRLFIGHWVNIWGYDDKKQIFYLYDSYISKRNPLILIGNVQRTYKQVLRDWRGTIYTYNQYLYMPVIYLKNDLKTIPHDH